MEVKDDFEDLYYKSIEQRKDLEKALFNTNELMKAYLSRCIILEKALGLLKDRKKYYLFVNENTETINVDFAIRQVEQVEREIGNEQYFRIFKRKR